MDTERVVVNNTVAYVVATISKARVAAITSAVAAAHDSPPCQVGSPQKLNDDQRLQKYLGLNAWARGDLHRQRPVFFAADW